MRAWTAIMVLSVIVSFSPGASQKPKGLHNSKPSAVAAKTVDCAAPNGYSVEEGTEGENSSVKIVSGGTVLHSIKLPTDEERNGFALDWAKKTKRGFEIAVEYGSVIFYSKRFIFICRRHRFYLSRISVESFDRHNPEKWNSRVITLKPNVPMEKFSIAKFMLEGVVK